MLYSLIMAGGAGTRFWPQSRAEQPKQLLALNGDRSMIQQTIDRLGDLIEVDRSMVMTSAALVDAVRNSLPQLPAEAVIGEPAKRDTAACIGLAAALLARRDPLAVMVVLPADHVIGPDQVFQQAIQHATKLVEQDHQRLITFGIKPSYPAESFGYIERGETLGEPPHQTHATYAVRQFHEKPDSQTAAEYLKCGTYYWNSGIFVWRAATILQAIRDFEPEMASRIDEIADAWETPNRDQVFAESFAAIKGKSIDYAVMERAKSVAVVEAPFEWDDLGSWKALARLRGMDENGNTVIGRNLCQNTRDCVIATNDDHLIATYNVNNLIIVHTSNATLVACRDDEESIRGLVAALKERGWHEFV